MALMGAGLLALALAVGSEVASAAEEPSSSLNAVVVTAGGRAELAQATPISLATHDRTQIERLGMNGIDDVARRTPGLSFVRAAYGATTQIAIRGLGSKLGASTTGLYVDDTPIQLRSLGFTAANAFPALFDLERVEVLRGPQGVLYGAGAEGGAVRFITPDADLSAASGRLKLEAGQVSGGGASYELGASGGTPIVENRAAVRLTLWTRREGGYIDRLDRESGRRLDRNANRQDSRLARLALALALSPRLTVSPKLEWQDRRQKDSNAYWEAFSDPGSGRFASGFRASQPDRDRWILPALKVAYRGERVLFTSSSSYFQRTDRSVVDYSTFIPASFGAPVVKALPGYLAYADMTNKQTAVNQEFRLQSATPGAQIDWLVGAYYGEARQRAIEAITDPQANALAVAALGIPFAKAVGQPLIDGRYSFLLNDVARDRQAAVFGELRVRPVRAVTLTGGLRAASARFEYEGRQDGGYAGGVAGGSGVQREHPVTPKLGVSVQAARETMVYASAAKGFRTGGVNPTVPASRCALDLAALGLSATPASYRSDHVWSYEAGLKTTLFDRRLALQSSAYWIVWDRIQQSVSLPGCGFLYTENLGAATSKGFELTLQARPVQGLLLSASLAYVDARFEQTVRGGVVDRVTGRRAVIVSAGDRLGARPWTLALSAEYRFQVRGGVPAYVRTDYDYLGPQAVPTPVGDPAAVAFDPGLPGVAEAHGLAARAGARLGHVELSVFADNLLDSAPQLLRAHDAKTSPLYAGVTQRPRTVGVTANYGF